MSIDLTSTAFQDGQTIPRQCTADGKDISPPLKWSNPPAITKSFALICEDPDAPRGTWTHWLLFNLPPSSRELTEGLPTLDALPDGSRQGTNDFGKVGYGGPAPPPGKPHRYLFRIYALDRELDLSPQATRQQLLDAMSKHVLAQGQLIGTYGRQSKPH
jgi:Raf kinase inhibitor-like YbhB/YbcL family protein